MAISEAAETPGIQDTRLWRMLPRYVDKAHAGTDWSMLKRVMDETSRRIGHCYVTCFVDLDGGNLPDMTEGRDAATEKAFTSELTEHQCSLDAIKEAAMDMSPAFRSGFAERLPEAVTVFDRYHVMASAGKATDKVRKEVGREEGGTWKKARCGRFEATRSSSRRGDSRSANGSAGITRIWGA